MPSALSYDTIIMFSKLVLASLAVSALSVNALAIPPSVKSSVKSGLGSVGELPRSFSALPHRDLTFVFAVAALLPTAAGLLINHFESQNDTPNSNTKREPEPELGRHPKDNFGLLKGDAIRLKRDPVSEDKVSDYPSSLVEPKPPRDSGLGVYPHGLSPDVTSPPRFKREPETWEHWAANAGDYYANKYGSPDNVPGLPHV